MRSLSFVQRELQEYRNEQVKAMGICTESGEHVIPRKSLNLRFAKCGPSTFLEETHCNHKYIL